MRFLLILLAAVVVFGQGYTAPESNSKVISAKFATQYFILDTTVCYRVNIHLNSASILVFPTRIKLAVCGNTKEIKTEIYDNLVEIKPLLEGIHSNLHVHLYSGEVITIELYTADHKDHTERAVFNYPDANPLQDLAKTLAEKCEAEKAALEDNLRAELQSSLPEEYVKDLMVYRIMDSRKSTALKYQGYLVTFDAMVSTKKYTYFMFSTNAEKNSSCPISAIDKIEVKSKTRDLSPLTLEPVLNTGDRIIVRTQILGDQYEPMKLFISMKFYNIIKMLKVKVS
jgi:hypothetical protein